MSANLLNQWKTIKSNFEQSTNKKKPGETLLVFFTKSSGLTPALKALDESWDDYAACLQATARFRKVLAEYLVVVDKAGAQAHQAAKQETDKTKKDAIENLVVRIGEMRLELMNMEAEAKNRSGHFDGLMKDALKPSEAAADDAKKLFAHATECIGKLEAIIKGKKAFIAELATVAAKMTTAEATLKTAREKFDAVVGSGPATKDTKVLAALQAADLAIKNHGGVSKKLNESIQQFRKLLNEPG